MKMMMGEDKDDYGLFVSTVSPLLNDCKAETLITPLIPFMAAAP